MSRLTGQALALRWLESGNAPSSGVMQIAALLRSRIESRVARGAITAPGLGSGANDAPWVAATVRKIAGLPSIPREAGTMSTRTPFASRRSMQRRTPGAAPDPAQQAGKKQEPRRDNTQPLVHDDLVEGDDYDAALLEVDSARFGGTRVRGGRVEQPRARVKSVPPPAPPPRSSAPAPAQAGGRIDSGAFLVQGAGTATISPFVNDDDEIRAMNGNIITRLVAKILG